MTDPRLTARVVRSRAVTLPAASPSRPVGWAPVFVGLFAALSGVGCGAGLPLDECAAGTHSASGDAAVACVACDAGEYSATTNAASCSAWTACVAGTYVSAEGSATEDRSCAACGTGTYSATANATACTAWQVCGAGDVESAPGSAMTDRTCSANEWTRQFGSADADFARSVSVGGDGSVLVAGHTNGSLPGQTRAAGGREVFLRKYDAAGNVVWTRQFGTAGNEFARSMNVGADGSVLVAGYTTATLPGQTSAGNVDAYVRKYDAAGTEVWTRQFGSSVADSAESVSVGADGSVLVAGTAGGTFPGQTSVGNVDAFVRKYDAAGTVVWTQQFGTTSGDSAVSVSVGADGSVLVAGVTEGTFPGQASAGDVDAYVRKYDAAGNEVWTQQFGTASLEIAHSISVGADGSVLVAGETRGTLPGQASAGGTDAFVMMLDEP